MELKKPDTSSQTPPEIPTYSCPLVPQSMPCGQNRSLHSPLVDLRFIHDGNRISEGNMSSYRPRPANTVLVGNFIMPPSPLHCHLVEWFTKSEANIQSLVEEEFTSNYIFRLGWNTAKEKNANLEVATLLQIFLNVLISIIYFERL